MSQDTVSNTSTKSTPPPKKLGSLLIRIEAPHFVAGVEQGKWAAPIIAYMQHWTVEQITEYCLRKNWKMTVRACK